MVRKNTIIRAVTLITILLTLSSNVYAKDKITIKIDGMKYEREYPDDLDEANKLIEYMVEMINTADDTVVKMKSEQDKRLKATEKENEELKSKLTLVEKELAEAKKNITSVEKTVDRTTKVNTRYELDFAFGPIFGLGDNAVGSHSELIMNYRVFRNFHIGGNIFFDAFTNTTRNLDIGACVMIGYSFH